MGIGQQFFPLYNRWEAYNKNVSLFLKNKGQYLLLEIVALSLFVYVYKL